MTTGDELAVEAGLPQPTPRHEFAPVVFYCPECRGPMDLGLVAMGKYTVWHCYHCQVRPDRPAHYSGTIVLRAGLAGPMARKRDRIELRGEY